MKAITYQKYGAADVLRLSEVVKPSPKGNEVLVRVHATTVTPVDCSFRAGDPFIVRLYMGLLRPRKNSVLGTELAGVVEAIGKDVTRFKQGDQVFAAPADGTGAHAEYICLPQDGALVLKPENISLEQAAAICNGALTALPFLRDSAKIKSGQQVLVIGASGSIGTFSVQLAKHFGAQVTAMCSTANLELVKSLGADRVVDYTKDDFTTQGRTYDIIFDTVAKSSFSQSKGSLVRGGVYLTTTPTFATIFHMLRAAVFGGKRAVMSATGLRPAEAQAKDLKFLNGLIKAATIKPVIDRLYPFEQIAKAYAYVETGHKRGNVVITLG